MAYEWSSDQKKAFDDLNGWFSDPNKRQFIVLGGLAGSGKTTLISEFCSKLKSENKIKNIAYCSFTGKATSVLRDKLSRVTTIRSDDFCGTIHSMIYIPIVDDFGDVSGWTKIAHIDYDLIVVDECSMVSRDIFSDLLSYKIPIICVGDHGQLPPVSTDTFNLMETPDIKLETVHRFQGNEGLIDVSTMARKSGLIKLGNYNDQVIKVKSTSPIIKQFFDKYMEKPRTDSVVLCGLNETRIDMNKKIRNKFNFIGDEPYVGDRVICLRNNKNAENVPVFNGLMGSVVGFKDCNGCYFTTISIDGESNCFVGPISKTTFNNKAPDMKEYILHKDYIMYKKRSRIGEHFQANNMIRAKNSKRYLDHFDYGYCITTHKSQGSEWKNVIVLEQRHYYMKDDDTWSRWLYTAVTRAREKLLIIEQ